MPIYYSLIARDTTVLVDHSENTGNFPQIAQTILAKVPREDTKCTYISGSYHFHVMTEENLVYICMTDEKMGKRVPYMFLEEIKQRFCAGSLKQRARTALSYGLKRDFQQVLSSQMEAFNSKSEGGPSSDRLTRVRQDVEDVKGIMTQNIGKKRIALPGAGSAMCIVCGTSNEFRLIGWKKMFCLKKRKCLSEVKELIFYWTKQRNSTTAIYSKTFSQLEECFRKASTFRTSAVRIKRKMWWQNTKMCLILIAVVLIIILVIVLVILGETGHLK